MNTAGLSLSDAPPFRLVYPFFVAAGVFSSLSFATFFLTGFESIYDPRTIASLHLFTIGFMLNAIMGSLLQMLPVVGGIKMSAKAVPIAAFFGVNVGALLFFCAFWFCPALKLAASLFLALPLLFALVSILIGILKQKNKAATIKNVGLALLGGILAVSAGAAALSELFAIDRDIVVKAHIFFAVFGFAGALIVSIAALVLPMFYVAKEFPKFCEIWPLLIVFTAVLYPFSPQEFRVAPVAVASTAFLAFAAVGLKKLKDRKRLIVDPSLWFWRVGLVCAAIGAVLTFWAQFAQINNIELLLAALLGVGFFGSIIQAMIYKIVPFLSWFHLTNIGKFDAPSSREFISEKMANIGVVLHVSSVVLFCASAFFGSIFYVASFVAAVSFALLSVNIIRAVRLYEKELLAFYK